MDKFVGPLKMLILTDDTLSGPDISRMTGVTKATVYAHIKRLLKDDIIKKDKKVGKTQLYRLNNSNPKAKIILMLERFIVSERLEKLVGTEKGSAISKFIDASHSAKAAELISP